MGWDYAINWLVILPFELTAAGITIRYWREDLNVGIWIAVFLVILSAIQIFGVRGYGEGKNRPLPFIISDTQQQDGPPLTFLVTQWNLSSVS